MGVMSVLLPESDGGLGLDEMIAAIREERPHRASGALGLHVLETALAALQSAEDGRTVEILRECANGGQVRLIGRAEQPGVLVLEIAERDSGGRRSERRLVMEKR